VSVGLKPSLLAAASLLEQRFGARLLARSTAFDELTYVVAPADWLEVLAACKDSAGLDFDELDCLLGDHLPDRPTAPFQVVAHLLSHRHNHRLRIKTELAEGASLPTLTEKWPSAGFDEREAWEMFGIVFDGHPCLKRLLTTDDFDGFPLRKDFPLRGTFGGRVRTELTGKI
jgi:NADH-quinone oxidoreductase subunit C